MGKYRYIVEARGYVGEHIECLKIMGEHTSGLSVIKYGIEIEKGLHPDYIVAVLCVYDRESGNFVYERNVLSSGLAARKSTYGDVSKMVEEGRARNIDSSKRSVHEYAEKIAEFKKMALLAKNDKARNRYNLDVVRYKHFLDDETDYLAKLMTKKSYKIEWF